MHEKYLSALLLLAYPLLLLLSSHKVDFSALALLFILLIASSFMVLVIMAADMPRIDLHYWHIRRSLAFMLGTVLFAIFVLSVLLPFVTTLGENAVCVFTASGIGIYTTISLGLSFFKYGHLRRNEAVLKVTDEDYRILESQCQVAIAIFGVVFIAFSQFIGFFSGLPPLDMDMVELAVNLFHFFVDDGAAEDRFSHTSSFLIFLLWFSYVLFVLMSLGLLNDKFELKDKEEPVEAE